MGLSDINYKGHAYTWSRGRHARTPMYQRLDKVVANDMWIHHFPNAYTKHMPRYLSDHAPILLFFHPTHRGNFDNNLHSTPFRFKNCWLTNPTLAHIVKQAWSPMTSSASGQNNPLSFKLASVTTSFYAWRRAFAPTYIKNNIKHMEQELLTIQYLPPSLDNMSKEASLQLNLEDLRNIENDYWKQRAKAHWLTDSDRNSKYFHAQATHRKTKILFWASITTMING